MRLFILILSTCLFSAISNAEVIPFDDERWTLFGEKTELVQHKGQDALYSPGGGAFLEGADFKDGVIEVDILFPNDERGFSGITWRMQPQGSYEHFYIRPHLSKKPDSTQYTPVFEHDTGWQLYFGSGHAVAVEVKYDQWMHIKIVVSGDQAEVYADSDEPVLFIDDLKADLNSGDIGVSTTFAPAYYSNFSYQKNDNLTLKGKPIPAEELPSGLIREFTLSEVVADDTVPADYIGAWTKQAVETTGAINISRNRARHKGHNTVLIHLTVNSDTDQHKKFTYGYSDDVVIYMYGKPISGGTNVYMSRDYRYLGTIGLFDDVYLPLEAGKNEIYFAVKENFGGWGFIGKFDDMSGINIP